MEVTVIRSDRKTIAIQINRDLTITVRAPRYAKRNEIEAILRKKESWIRKHIEQIKLENAQNRENEIKYLTDQEIEELAERAVAYIPGRVAYFSKIIGVTYGRITIRNQKTRWGSCSSKGNLNFNCLLMLMPSEIIDYVVVHELCHRKEMNHSKNFWREVEKILPDYKAAEQWMKNEGGQIMRRQKR